MVRIAGIDLPKKKRILIALTYIYGIGKSRAKNILEVSKIDFNKKTDDLKDTELTLIRQYIDKQYKIEGDLKRDIAMSIKRLMDIGSYRGLRHRKKLPVRGQRTHTNARTRKGPRKSLVSKKK